MEFLPAYNQNKQKACYLLEFTEINAFDPLAPRSYGRQWTRTAAAVVSYQDGTVEGVDIEDLVILWDMWRVKGGVSQVPSFTSIERAYKEAIK